MLATLLHELLLIFLAARQSAEPRKTPCPYLISLQPALVIFRWMDDLSDIDVDPESHTLAAGSSADVDVGSEPALGNNGQPHALAELSSDSAAAGSSGDADVGSETSLGHNGQPHALEVLSSDSAAAESSGDDGRDPRCRYAKGPFGDLLPNAGFRDRTAAERRYNRDVGKLRQQVQEQRNASRTCTLFRNESTKRCADVK